MVTNLLLLNCTERDLSSASSLLYLQWVLTSVLKRVSLESSAKSKATLDIAVCCRKELLLWDKAPQSINYDFAQHALARVYRVACYVCAKEKIDIYHENEVDFRVLLTYLEGDEHHPEQSETESLGPVLSIGGLAKGIREWQSIYQVADKAEEVILEKFYELRRPLIKTGLVPSFKIEGLTPNTSPPRGENPTSYQTDSPSQHHYSVAVGGTFDHLHVGHKLLLSAVALSLVRAAQEGPQKERSITIGITGDELLKNKKFAEVLESWDDRQQGSFEFLRSIIGLDQPENVKDDFERIFKEGPNGKAIHHRLGGNLVIKCVEIQDPFGPTITDPSITALVVSGETRSGGKAVNDKRIEKGWRALQVFEVDVLDAQLEAGKSFDDAFESKISSTEIRKRLQQQKL
jgi:phosphopantetheine adenylyltransferase